MLTVNTIKTNNVNRYIYEKKKRFNSLNKMELQKNNAHNMSTYDVEKT